VVQQFKNKITRKNMDWKESAATWKTRYPTSTLQAEFFLLKFIPHGVSRQEVCILLNQFQKFDSKRQGELEEDEALHLLESRGETKTASELRKLIADIDQDKNRKLSFLEFSCAVLNRSWQTLHEPVGDPDALAELEKLKVQAELHKNQSESEREAKRVEEEKALNAYLQKSLEKDAALQKHTELEATIKKKKEEEERKRTEEEEKRKHEVGKSGVKGRAAMFDYTASDTADPTSKNAEQIKAEAASRKAKHQSEVELKKAEEEAKKAEEEAKRAADAKKKAEEEAIKKMEEANHAEQERHKAERGKLERESYEREKAKAEAEERAKKDEDEKKKAESKARLASKAAAFQPKQ